MRYLIAIVACALLVLAPVQLRADDAEQCDTASLLVYRLCWCKSPDGWACTRVTVVDSCWDLAPTCREPGVTKADESRCRKLQQQEGSPPKFIRPQKEGTP